MRIALIGNPNSGKTTMYNALTGSNEKVGNWAGVTVEKKESSIKKSIYGGTEELIAVDLPGAYSMSPFTSEESITSAYVKNENPDAIINIVDATNLSRSLFFTTQLLELGIPVVVALNKSDINEKKDTEINVELLAEKLGCPVVETVSTSSGDNGLKEVVEKAAGLAGLGQQAVKIFGNDGTGNANQSHQRCADTQHAGAYDQSRQQSQHHIQHDPVGAEIAPNMGRRSNCQFHFAFASLNICLPLRKRSTKGSLPGQVNAQLPHSMQSSRCSRSSSSSRAAFVKRYMYSGCRRMGQTLTHLPQRRHTGFSAAPFWSFSRHKMELVALTTGTCRSLWAKPIMGPPLITRSVLSCRPPATSIRSRKGVPMRTIKFCGSAMASPETVTIRWVTGNPRRTAR